MDVTRKLERQRVGGGGLGRILQYWDPPDEAHRRRLTDARKAQKIQH